ncbi:MAG: caspase family protein, partial [Deltaproteobacteria bacterium]|nr:caspase family protein [Deltaproteobacteria bacterium]
RLLVVDACRSGALTRVKGGTTVPAFPIQLGDTLAADGVVFWTASAASEQAQESDAIKGSFFTLFLVSGLAGPADEDGDGDVTTTEAYDYARAATLRASSRTLAGTQHPTFRDELAGRDAVVLTRPGTLGPARAQLRTPDGRDVLVLAGNADGPVIAEVGVHDRMRRVNVRAGRYFIRQRLQTHLLEGAVTVAAGEDLRIEDKGLARVEYVRVASKGLERVRRDSIEAGLLARTPIVDGGDFCLGVVAGYAIDLGWVTVTPRLAACRERSENAFLATATDELTADARVSHVWVLGRISLTAQVQLGAAMLHQRFATEGNAPSRTISGALFGAGGSVGVALGAGTSLHLATELNSFVLRRGDAMAAHWDSTLSLGAVLSVGVQR